MRITSGQYDDAARAEVLAALDGIRAELAAIARAADEALRTGDPGPLARLHLAPAHAARDALLAVVA